MATAHHLNYEGLVAEHIVKKEPIPFEWVWLSPHRVMIFKHLKQLKWRFYMNHYTPPVEPENARPYAPYTLA